MLKVLVPTDFSDYAEKATFYAAGLVKKSEGELYLLHVCKQLNPKYSRHENLIKEYNDQEISDLSSRLSIIQEKIGREGVNVHTLLYHGEIKESILWVAEKNDIDIIVMGTQGADGIKTVIFGTKAAGVIQESIFPVITVPYNYTWKEPKRILLALQDASEDPELFKTVFQLASLFGAQIKIAVFSDPAPPEVTVNEQAKTIDSIQQKLSNHYNTPALEIQHLLGKDFHQTIQEYIDTNQIDLLVMVTHKRKLMQRLFKFSMTRQMAYHATIPLLSLQSMQS